MGDTLTHFLSNSLTGVGSVDRPASASEAPAQLVEAAQSFEAIFLSQFLDTMTKDLQGGAFGDSENAITGLIKDEYASLISKSGGIGVGDAVLREMLKIQEIA